MSWFEAMSWHGTPKHWFLCQKNGLSQLPKRRETMTLISSGRLKELPASYCGFRNARGWTSAFSVGLMSSWVTRAPGFVIKIGFRVLAYLANAKILRLSLIPEGPDALSIFTDASFAPFSERSISGIVVMMNNRCVFWKSRRQTLVSLSTS